MKGVAQNIEEYRIALNDNSGLIAKISDISVDYRYLIMDKAKPIRDISYVWDFFHVRSNQNSIKFISFVIFAIDTIC